MKQGPWLIVAASALLLVGVAVWILASDDLDRGLQSVTVIATDMDPPPDMDLLHLSNERLHSEMTARPLSVPTEAGQAPAADAATVPPHVVLTGRVTRAGDGRPVAAVEVSARVRTAGGRTVSTTVAATDAEGAYRMLPTHGGTLVRLDVASGPDTTRTTLRTERPVPEGAETIVDIEVPEGVALAGTVVDGDGRPVPFAQVMAWTGKRYTIERERPDDPDRIVRADVAGAFEVDAIGPRFLLEARSEEAVPADRLHGEIRHASRVSGLVLQVSPARSLRVEVRGHGDRAQPAAAVAVRHALHDASEQVTAIEGVFRTGPREISELTDDDGWADLKGLASLVNEVEVAHHRHAPWTGQHAPGDPDLLVRLDAGARLLGRVTDERGVPIPGAVVQVSSTDPSLMDRNRRRSHADAEGRFEFVGLQPDEAALLCTAAPGHAVNVMEGLSVQEEWPSEVRVVLGPEYPLSGLVTDATGVPVAQALVEIEGDRQFDFGGMTMSPAPTWERMLDTLDRTRSDEDGRFRLGGLYEGLFRVRVTDPEDPTSVARLDARSGDSDLLVVLDGDANSGVTLAGSVHDALTGRPIQEFEVTPMIPSGNGGMAGTSWFLGDDLGSFRISGLEPGQMQVHVQAKGYAPWSRALRDYGPGLHLLDVDLMASRTARLRFVDVEQAPVVDADVRFSTMDAKRLMVAHGPGSRTLTLRTDESGEVIASELPADRIVVEIYCNWLDSGHAYTVDLRAPPSRPIELVVDRPQRLELTVLVVGDASGAQQTAYDGIEGAADLLSLQSRLQEGSLSALDVPTHVEVRDGAGNLVAKGLANRETSVLGGALPVGVSAARLDVPREALSLRIEASGYDMIELPWMPGSKAVESEAVVVTFNLH